jgi:hypothetical protein
MSAVLHHRHEATDYVAFDYEGYTSNPNISFLEEEQGEPLPLKVRRWLFGASVAAAIAVPSAWKIYEWWMNQ